MPELSLLQWLMQGGAVAILLYAVWSFMTGKVFSRFAMDEKNVEIRELKTAIKELNQTITELMTELREGSTVQREAADAVRPEDLEKMVRQIAAELRRKR